ncbi:hypothetical protein ELQ92_08935 [Labedella populi]|uniref:Uncharacterized protein n=1 Tax=Labedella populi TaxID=2498850 RepID=A0A3S5CK40_9MICO|nr:hypothetical protein [Labedella populi]RWZ61154.1 hypothetical protein ELQ92_08935 [Labedella populi]
MADPHGLIDIADELYAASLDAFTSTRNARAAAARKAGDRELATAVSALTKPTAAAWASNLLFRSSPWFVQEISDLRARIEAASGTGDRDALRELTGSRHALVDRLVDAARSVTSAAGRPLSPAAAEDLAETVTAALGDPDIEAALATGRLTAPPRSGGMSRNDLARIVALPPAEFTRVDPDDDVVADDAVEDDAVEDRKPTGRRSARLRPAPSVDGTGGATERPRTRDRPEGPTAGDRRRHERGLRAAEERADRARADREGRERERDALAGRRDELAAEVTRQKDVLQTLERRLEDAVAEVDALTADIRSRELEWKRAESAARSARRVVDQDRAAEAETER